MGHSASKNQISEYRPEFEVLRIIDSPNYGRAKLIRENLTNSNMILKEFLFDTKEAFEEEVLAFEERAAFDHPNIIQILGYYVTENSNFCSNLFKVSVFIESLPKDLETDIKERKAANQFYNEQEILIIADCAVAALFHFQTKGLAHGDIRPANIFVAGQTYKVSDPKLEVDQNANGVVKAILGRTKTLLTPSLLKQVPISDFEVHEDKNRADVFALGATLLNVATLEKSEDLYNYDKGEFNEELLHQRLHQISQMYSPFTAGLIRDMLQIDEGHRPDFVALRDRLYNFSREHNLPPPKAKGWEEGRFSFGGPSGDDKKAIVWKYKQETRLAYEVRTKGEAHRLLEEEKSREREQQEREKEEALRKKEETAAKQKEEAVRKKEEALQKKEEEKMRDKEKKEEVHREKEAREREKVKKSALPTHDVHTSSPHTQKVEETYQKRIEERGPVNPPAYVASNQHTQKVEERGPANPPAYVSQQNAYNQSWDTLGWNSNANPNTQHREQNAYSSQGWNNNVGPQSQKFEDKKSTQNPPAYVSQQNTYQSQGWNNNTQGWNNPNANTQQQREQNAYSSQGWNNNTKVDVQQRDTFGTQNQGQTQTQTQSWNFNNNQNTQASYNQNAQPSYNQNNQNIQSSYSRNVQANYNQNPQLSSAPGFIGFPDQPDASKNNPYQQSSSPVKTTFVQYNQQAVESPVKSYQATYNTQYNQQVEAPVRSYQANYDAQYNQRSESPMRSSYQSGMERPSRAKQLHEYSKEENIASYNYAVGGSPLRRSRSPDGTLRMSAAGNLAQSGGYIAQSQVHYSPTRQGNMPEFTVPVNKNDSPFKNLY